MKKKDLIGLKNKTNTELTQNSADFMRQITELRLELKLGNSKNVHELNVKKKDLARILTLLKIQEMIKAQKPGSLKVSVKKEEEHAPN